MTEEQININKLSQRSSYADVERCLAVTLSVDLLPTSRSVLPSIEPTCTELQREREREREREKIQVVNKA